jgi:hypothetical protein
MFAEEEERTTKPGLGSFRGPELPSSASSLSERLRYGREQQQQQQLDTNHQASVSVVPPSRPSLIAAPSISLQSPSVAFPYPPHPLSHHGRSLLVLAHHLLPQVLARCILLAQLLC